MCDTCVPRYLGPCYWCREPIYADGPTCGCEHAKQGHATWLDGEAVVQLHNAPA